MAIQCHVVSILNSLETKLCNCKKGNVCPLEGKCLQEGVVYQAKVTPTNSNYRTETYIGLTGNEFKGRYNTHNQSFNSEEDKNATALSQYIWKLKEKKVGFKITWRIVSRSKPFTPGALYCNLCVEEKYLILCSNLGTLNKRSELTNNCRHKKKYLLKKCKVSNTWCKRYSTYQITLMIACDKLAWNNVVSEDLIMNIIYNLLPSN